MRFKFCFQCENTGDPFHDYSNNYSTDKDPTLGIWAAIYWLLVTMSTVGFGEISPSTDIARAFIVVYIIGTFVSQTYKT